MLLAVGWSAQPIAWDESGSRDPFRGVPGGGAPWRIASGSGEGIDRMGRPHLVNLSTGDFAASATGDSEIEAVLELPRPASRRSFRVESRAGAVLKGA
jgi:hypothetical protein